MFMYMHISNTPLVIVKLLVGIGELKLVSLIYNILIDFYTFLEILDMKCMLLILSEDYDFPY